MRSSSRLNDSRMALKWRQLDTIWSIGASARPISTLLAIMAPAVISPLMTRSAPAPSAKDCWV
jgi:hypothetical protein